MTRRAYRLWDYTASHAQLVVRAVADESRFENDDRVFAGVGWIQLPEVIFDLTVRPASSDDSLALPPETRTQLDDTNRLFLLEGTDEAGGPVTGMIVARDYRRDRNERPFYDTVLRELVSPATAAYEFEKQVVAALARLPKIELSVGSSGPFDGVLTTDDGRVIALEVKHYGSQPAPRAVRSIVMQIVTGLDRLADVTDVLVILGGEGVHLVGELREHLITALTPHARPTVVGWQPTDGIEPLARAISTRAA